MNRFLKGTGEGDGQAPFSAAPSDAPEALTAFIDQGSEFEGRLSFKNTVRIDGSFKGEISSENTLIVGEPGTVDASIRSRHVIVSGEVSGDIVASERLVVHKTGRVHGDIQTPKLVVEDGAVIEGRVQMESAGKGARPNGPAKGAEGGAKPAAPPAS